MLNAVGNCYFASFGNLNETFCLGKILQYYIFLSIILYGEMAEWSKAAVY